MFFYSIFTSGLSVSQAVLVALAFLLVAVLSIVMHESAHAFAAYKSGDMTPKLSGRLTLNPVKHFDMLGLIMMLLIGFGWAKPVPINPNNFTKYKKGMLWTSLAGILTNLGLAAIGLGVLGIFHATDFLFITYGNQISATFATFLLYFVIYLVMLNFMLAFFNILPICPLDGFNVLNVLLPHGNKYSTFMLQYGRIVLLALIVLSSVFRMLGLWYLNIFGMFSSLIQDLIWAVLK